MSPKRPAQEALAAPPDRIVRVKATPNARRESVEAQAPDLYAIATREKPEQGRANARIRDLLAAALGLPPDRVVLLSGAHHPAKKFRLLPPRPTRHPPD
jgi:uncharacterized protein YggU (UPF0235/DUF167 family)